MSATLLLMLAGLAHFAPELLAQRVGGSEAAWDYITHGAEAAGLWAFIGATSSIRWPLTFGAIRIAAVFGAVESAQRPLCRLAFPLDHAPRLPPGQHLCDAAFGPWIAWLGITSAAFAALLFYRQIERATA